MTGISLQQALVSSYLQEFSVKKVIGHDSFKYIQIVGKYVLLIGLVVGCALFFALFESISDVILKWIYSILMIAIYIGCIYELLDTYLDTLVVTDSGLILFQRHSPFSQTTSVIQWVAIESIEHAHFGFWSSMFNLGNLRIQVEDQRYAFDRVASPAHTLQQILRAKSKYMSRYGSENMPVTHSTPSGDKNNYDLFVEALGEVMEEYMKKKNM